MKRSAFMAAIVIIAISCQSTKEAAGEQGPKSNPPTVKELFKQMDADNDDKLSAAEVTGPLKNDFAKIDTNNDGYISKEELNRSPKPNRQPPPPPKQ